jgi:hypothetical protein
MRAAIPRIYKSFEEFEREELRKLDSLGGSIDEMLDEVFAEELDFEPEGGKRGGKRRAANDDDEE